MTNQIAPTSLRLIAVKLTVPLFLENGTGHEMKTTEERQHGLSSTSALVLKWLDGDIHKSAASQRYFSNLDLRSAEDIFTECDAVWKHYSEVIKNRKYAILNLARERLDRTKGLNQIVILGAGFDALSIELAVSDPELSLFEMDHEGTTLKQSLLSQATPEVATQIRCLEVDLHDPKAVTHHLKRTGWDPRAPSLVVAEGISYYLSPKEMTNLFEVFSKPGNQFIFEYLLEDDFVEEPCRRIPKDIFSIIMRRCNIGAISRYDPNTLNEIARETGYHITVDYDLSRIEHERTGRNALFSSSSSGWIRIAHLVAAAEFKH